MMIKSGFVLKRTVTFFMILSIILSGPIKFGMLYHDLTLLSPFFALILVPHNSFTRLSSRLSTKCTYFKYYMLISSPLPC